VLGPAILVLGDAGGLAEALLLRLAESRIAAEYATPGDDAETSAALARDRWRGVVIVTRDDILALRLSLLSAQLRPDLPVWTTLFDATIARELHHAVPGVNVLSPSQLVAVELTKECVNVGASPMGRARSGVRLVDNALRLQVAAGVGLLLALIVQAGISMVALHQNVIDALYFSTRLVATVADAPGAVSSPAWFKLVSAAATIAALLLVAVFTAALVRRLSGLRLTTLLGARMAPARGHVLLVGCGQVGFRLAQELRRRGIPVIAIERDPAAPCVRLARSAGLPVAIGRGDDRATLELLGIRRCAVVAAVTSTDLVNVEVGLAASALSPGIPVVLRLGDGEVAAETDSLLHLGRICDAHAIAADALVRALGAAEGHRPPAPDGRPRASTTPEPRLP
jgi:voltage-gated potassium channel Kch